MFRGAWPDAIYAIALGVLAGLVCSLALAQTGSGLELRPHDRATRELTPDQRDIFTVQAEPGEYLQIVAVQHGIDFAMTLAGPSNNLLLTADLASAFLARKSV